MVSLSAIEQAIKDAIKNLGREYLNEIRTYGGEFDDDLNQVVKKFPAVWVTFSGAPSVKTIGAKKWHVDLTWTVLVGARSVRNEETARQGTVVNGQQFRVGSYQLVSDVLYAVAGQDFGLSINQMQPGKIMQIFNTKTNNEAVSVLAIDFHTYMYVDRTDFASLEADWLEKINVDYHLDPASQDSQASDLINLNQY